MSLFYKRSFTALMILAMAFGFFHLFISKETIPFDFERLHIFLFNLCAGGGLILFHTRRNLPRPMGGKLHIFIMLSLLFALAAFLESYIPAMICAASLAILVESERIRTFSFFPIDFFKDRVPVEKKFHQAALLCLSMGLATSVVVMFNESYANWVSMEKLTLNTFFLGFSFPVSLITMSVMFQIIGDNRVRTTRVLKNIGFWSVNLGVIIFFIFILFEWPSLQLVISLILFGAVLLILILFLQDPMQAQQKAFLTSGMFFLVFTGISGIAYILLEMTPYYTQENGKILLKMHSFASLYGWNLSGLVVIMRYEDFPIKLHSRTLIMTHWITVLVLAPLGYFSPFFALVGLLAYIVLLEVLFFSARSAGEEVVPHVLTE
ncbi:hypothetical protein [Desulfobotulus mexicanus]|uniref:Cbb3-type cytochrome c oxidase subunit I n=1 Tax=Desulfobotulus mexicanus TaxID=2586642 RepID=A0A5S5MCC7_9BACT|nr:hypothetical protein [Desulfobotulus mexicanus]TYT73372.1 hypothetical protein FIM25_15540 [Desulfobotulus mexicanus]